MDIRKRNGNNREPIEQRRLRKFAEERESKEANRQLAAERETHIQVWLLVLKLLFEIPRKNWTADDQTLAMTAARNLQTTRLHACNAREERDRLLFLYQDYLKKAAAKIQPQKDEDEL
jgi:hypothetical protein